MNVSAKSNSWERLPQAVRAFELFGGEALGVKQVKPEVRV
jgi:hypothetical protein